MSIEQTIDTPLASAVRAAGSQSAFGRLIGRRQSTVNDWLRLKKSLPAEHVLLVERELGISKHLLRPDIYPVEHGSPSPSPAANAAAANDAIGLPLESRENGGIASHFETAAIAA